MSLCFDDESLESKGCKQWLKKNNQNVRMTHLAERFDIFIAASKNDVSILLIFTVMWQISGTLPCLTKLMDTLVN